MRLAVLLAILLTAVLAACAVAVGQPISVNLTWTAPTTYVDGTGIPPASLTFNVYQGTAPGQEVVTAQSVVGAAYTATGLQPGTEYCWKVTAVSGAGEESARSAEVCQSNVASTSAAPNAPSNLTERTLQ